MQRSLNKFENILIVRLGAMGDIVHVIPAVKNVRESYPSAHIAWLVEDKLKDLVDAIPGIDEVVVFPRKRWQAHLKNPQKYFQMITELRAFLKKLRQKRYDVALDFHGNFKSGLLSYLSRARYRIGFSRKFGKEFNFIFQNVCIAPEKKRIHRVDKYLALVQCLGITTHYQRPEFLIPEADRHYIDRFILQNHLQERPLAMIHPGTSVFGKFKRWPPEKYSLLADRLTQELHYAVVFTWGPLEYKIAEEIISLMHTQGTIACKTSSVKQLIALLQRAHLFIGSDTGPTHIASYIGIPTIAIFGPKDPAIYAPYGENSLVVRKDIACSPCAVRECGHVTCIHSITPDDVFNAVGKLKQKRSLTF
ncbi:MAG: lipopolysaccharide heptosyltransferase II [Candidatus Brocadiaceae bacterium]|nr:lipopolysaccharide heptosyltransferase II [Candidatus Brocadiaceae bacterium]